MTKRALLIAAALLVASTVAAQGAAPIATVAPTVTIHGDAHVPAGAVHDAEIVAIGGDVRIEGRVTGDVVVIFGTLDISGSVEGEVVSIFSATRIARTAEIEGQLVNVGGTLERDPESRIGGEIVDLNLVGVLPFMGDGLHGLARFWFHLKLAKLAALFFLLVLVSALVPRRLEVIATAFPERWGAALLMGIAAYAVVPIVVLFLLITLIGAPLAVALGLALLVVKWLGLASILYLAGSRLGRNLFHRELPHVAAVLGGFVPYALISLIPVLGFLFGLVMSFLAVGIAIVTRFGSEEAWRRRSAPAA